MTLGGSTEKMSVSRLLISRRPNSFSLEGRQDVVSLQVLQPSPAPLLPDDMSSTTLVAYLRTSKVLLVSAVAQDLTAFYLNSRAPIQDGTWVNSIFEPSSQLSFQSS